MTAGRQSGPCLLYTSVYARIDKELKENAEGILSKLGISPSSAIQMLYSQIVLRRGIPFELRLPSEKPVAVGGMTHEQLDAELMKGVESLKSGKTYTAVSYTHLDVYKRQSLPCCLSSDSSYSTRRPGIKREDTGEPARSGSCPWIPPQAGVQILSQWRLRDPAAGPGVR